MARNMAVCRICLATDERMFNIIGTLQLVYEKITNAPLLNDKYRPVVACYYCFAQLNKCHRLMQTSKEAENILVEMMEKYPEVTTELVAMIDRKANNLSASLTVSPIKYFDTSTFNAPIMVKDESDANEVNESVREDSIEIPSSGAVCRVCLAININMYNIAGTPLQFVYENMTDNLLHTADKRPLSACYICRAQLTLCRKLMLKANKSENVLTAIIEKHSEVSKKFISKFVDRQANNLCAPLRILLVDYFDSSNNKNIVRHDYMDVEVKIEVEPDLYVGSPSVIDMASSDVDSKDQSDSEEASKRARVGAWEVKVSGTREGDDEVPKRKTRRRRVKQNIETEAASEPKREKPRRKRVYKKRIRAYVHECSICQRMFNRTNHLKDHMKTHTDDRPYECNVCHRRFIQKINLKNHLMTHTGEKPYECDICQSSFIAKSDFKRHINTHNEERNFECSLCHRRFTQMPYLKAHIGTHTSEKPYECHLCQRRFSQKPYLKNHLKRHADNQT